MCRVVLTVPDISDLTLTETIRLITAVRVIDQLLTDPSCSGLTPDEIRASVTSQLWSNDTRMDRFLTDALDRNLIL
jgi:hypothetical protein